MVNQSLISRLTTFTSDDQLSVIGTRFLCRLSQNRQSLNLTLAFVEVGGQEDELPQNFGALEHPDEIRGDLEPPDAH